ncbi:hypothetical protein [Streptomyces scopuliridis]|uniref:Uncharacterized protein n=1 Tax=Streptomyces scopuliridis TaxID=452529 RepID=A0ACD4ZS83_9ACTN|nr:hypothetical protein [Streptomyces scopuliridis]WSC01259.1 hypothetical protein OG835_32515 [Streptomyces scopuliridis]
MNRLPSLDEYDVQGVRQSEAALWGDDVRYAVEELIAADLLMYSVAVDAD